MATEIKLVLVGTGGVGKSAITLSYVARKFVTVYDPTIEDSHRKQVSVDGIVHMLDILDTAGQEEFACMQDEWFRTGEGFLLVFDVTKKDTLFEVERLMKKVQLNKQSSKVAAVLCGNKCDLVDRREVTEKEAQALAASIDCPYFEVSAKEQHNVDSSFEQLVREVRKLRKAEGKDVGGVKNAQSSGGLGSSSKGKKLRCILI